MTTSVVEREVLKLSLAGRDFEWERPTRRVARAQQADIIDIGKTMAGGQAPESAGVDEDGRPMMRVDPAGLLRGANMALQFLYRYNNGLAVRRAYFDEHAETDELVRVIREIEAFLTRPTDGSAGDILNSAEPETTPTA